MPVPMVNIRLVWMGMAQWFVLMPMTVRFAWWIMGAMRMVMMLVVVVKVFVFQRFVNVPVLVMLCKVQPDACGHEATGQEQSRRDCVVKKQDGNNGPDERGG